MLAAAIMNWRIFACQAARNRNSPVWNDPEADAKLAGGKSPVPIHDAVDLPMYLNAKSPVSSGLAGRPKRAVWKAVDNTTRSDRKGCVTVALRGVNDRC